MVNSRNYSVALISFLFFYTLSAESDLTLPGTDSKTQKSRMRKTHTEKKRKISTYRDMTLEELCVAKDQFVKQRNYTSALKYLDQMIKICEDVTTMGKLLVEIADLLVLDDQLNKAAQKYAEYAAMYPGGDLIEYALFKAIECSFACTFSYDRDQTKTEETLALAEQFLKQDHFIRYADEVKNIRDKCYDKLAQSELNICFFYLQRTNLKQAEKRLIDIRTTWLCRVPAIENTLLTLEAELENQKIIAEQKIAKATQLTHNNTKKHMSDRF